MKSYLRRASASYTYSGLAVRLPIHLDRAHGHDPRFWPRRLAALAQPFTNQKARAVLQHETRAGQETAFCCRTFSCLHCTVKHRKTQGEDLFMNQMMTETVLYRTYEYRLYPTAEQQNLLLERFDFADTHYNALARRLNDLHARSAGLETARQAVAQYSAACPGPDFQTALAHIQKELYQAAERLWRGSYTEIFPRPVTRRRRGFYYKMVAVSDYHVIVPVVGAILRDTHRPLPAGAKVLSGMIFCSTYETRYSVHLLVAYTAQLPAPAANVPYDRAIGLDYAQDGLYRDSDGRSGGYPAFAARAKGKRDALLAALARCRPGSNRSHALQARLAKLDRHTANQRKDWQCKQAKALLADHDLVAVESLDFAAMKRQLPQLAAKIDDNRYVAFLQTLQNQAALQGKRLVRVGRYFPSSQICSACGAQLGKLPLGQPFIRCPHCGTVMQRDLNAAKNILAEGLRCARS